MCCTQFATFALTRSEATSLPRTSYYLMATPHLTMRWTLHDCGFLIEMVFISTGVCHVINTLYFYQPVSQGYVLVFIPQFPREVYTGIYIYICQAHFIEHSTGFFNVDSLPKRRKLKRTRRGPIFDQTPSDQAEAKRVPARTWT